MSEEIYGAVEALVRQVHAHLDYRDDADMERVADRLWDLMHATGTANPALVKDLVAEVDAHLDYEDDAGMQEAVERVRALVPEPTAAEVDAAHAAKVGDATEDLCAEVGKHLDGWKDEDMERARDALRALMDAGGGIDHDLLAALAAECEAQLEVEEIPAMQEAVERVRDLLPAPTAAPAP